MMPVAIRAYEAADWPRLMAIHDSARMDELRHAGLEAAFIPLSVAAEREGLFDYTLGVAAVEGEAVGFVAFSPEELAWLYVDPAHAGKGIGRQLIRHALEHTTGPLAVEVLEGNAPALHLYERMGFVSEGMATGSMPGNEAFQVTVCCLRLPRSSSTTTTA